MRSIKKLIRRSFYPTAFFNFKETFTILNMLLFRL
jgi:hypothetical protein